MKRRSILTLVICVIAISLYLFYINRINIAIRTAELAGNLNRLDRNERSIDHITLVATYEISKKIFEKHITRDDADLLEQTVAMLAGEDGRQTGRETTGYGMALLPGIWLINFNRMVLGKEQIQNDIYSGYTHVELDVAFYYERNYIFEQAIRLYDKILSDRRIDSSLRASVLLHQGYCYALSGQNDKARANYLLIIKKHPQENSAVTAAILLKYLEGFRLAHERILGGNSDPLTMSRDLMNLMAYRQALKILKETEKTARSDDIPMIKYFMARCYTGIGQPGTAVETYLDLITRYPSSEYARYANRRILLIGIRSRDARIVDISKKINTVLKDPLFDRITAETDYTGMDRFSGLVKIDIPEKSIASVDRYTDEKKKSTAQERHLVITTSDGNTFKGTMVKETSTEIVLNTSIGIINVKKDKITAIKGR